MSTYTDQEAFDLCYHHMMRQGRRSSTRGFRIPRSLYRGPSGLKCPIGALIPNEEYSKDLEDTGVFSLVTDKVVPSLVGLDPNLLHDIQLVHDEQPVRRWGKALRSLAERYGLETSRQRRRRRRNRSKRNR